MKAILFKTTGEAKNLYIGECENPQLHSNELLVKVRATALNRADIMQRRGQYPPPKGASPILGLEMAGEVVKIGKGVSRWKVGDGVCGLLSGGGYAQYVSIHKDLALPIPNGFSMEQAAAIPEVFLTAFQSINWLGKLKKGEDILIHAGASGVGTAAIQLAKKIGASNIYVTASAPKHDSCLQLGATKAIDYQTQNFQSLIQDWTNGKGVHLIIDFLAASYFQKNINSLALDGRMVMLSLLGGIKVPEFNLANILLKRLHIKGSTLRSRSLEYKIKLTHDFKNFAWKAFEDGELKPVIDSIWDWEEVIQAHEYMEANKNKGKIILAINS